MRWTIEDGPSKRCKGSTPGTRPYIACLGHGRCFKEGFEEGFKEGFKEGFEEGFKETSLMVGVRERSSPPSPVEGAMLPYPSLRGLARAFGPLKMLGPSKMALGGGGCPLAWAFEDGPSWGRMPPRLGLRRWP